MNPTRLPEICLIASLVGGCAAPERIADSPHFTMIDGAALPSVVREASGLDRSEQFEDVWWIHNDSGDVPRLFAIDSDGRLIEPAEPRAVREREGVTILGARHVDWEDIAVTGGRIYISDLGNNCNDREDLVIYVIDEPDPRATRTAHLVRRIPVRFEDQGAFPPRDRRFDCESLFIDNGVLYVLTKHRRGDRCDSPFVAGTNLYRLDLTSAREDAENILIRVDHHTELFAPTGADLSPDGRRLAVLTRRSLWLFERPDVDGRWLSGPARRIPLPSWIGKAEAICWDDHHSLRIASEDSSRLFRVQPVHSAE
jgi:hypothetical protein